MNTGGEFKDKDVIGLRICKRSLLLLEEDNGEVYVCIHQVVRDAIQRLTKQLSETERFEVVHASILSFNQFTIDRTTDSNDFTANEFRLLVPQLRFLSMQIEAIFKENDLSEAIKNSTFNFNYPSNFNCFGQICCVHFDLKAGKRHYERALAIRLQTLGPQHPNVASSYNNVAAVLCDEGDLKQAKEYHGRALAISLQTLGPQHS